MIVGAGALALAILWTALGPPLLANLTDGAGPGGEALFTLGFYGPLLVVALIGARLSGLAAFEAGTGTGRWLLPGAALGAAGILIATVYAWLAGTLVRAGAGEVRPLLLLGGCGVVFLQVLAEEAYFRGWLQPLATRAWGQGAAVVVTALAFALVHVIGGVRAPVSILNMVLGGVLFGILAQKGGGIWPAVAAHFAWNAIEQLGLGLDPNPGLGGFGALVNLDLLGIARWGGSDEGLNASIGMTFALVALLVPLVMLRGRAGDRRIVIA